MELVLLWVRFWGQSLIQYRTLYKTVTQATDDFEVQGQMSKLAGITYLLVLQLHVQYNNGKGSFSGNECSILQWGELLVHETMYKYAPNRNN